MRLLSFVRNGDVGFGLEKDKGIVNLTDLMDGVWTIKRALELDLLESIKDVAKDRDPDFSWTDVTPLPVIPDPGKIICVGLNYANHVAETKRPDSKYPTIFTRFADSQIGHNGIIYKPRVSDALDYEGEMAVIIGKGGREITKKAAMGHVAGYACYNDATVRDWQRHTSQFTPGKNYPSTGGFGPFMVTTDEVGDYKKLKIQTRLNGNVMQDAKLSQLIFPIPELINYISSFSPLSPGDVIVSGTPGGVGDRREPPVYMKDGDLIEIEITKLGVLKNRVVAE
tara:strand:- start:250 stop:1095 length:846 start_codon:yes stop_codon:yes gene_type:complete